MFRLLQGVCVGLGLILACLAIAALAIGLIDIAFPGARNWSEHTYMVEGDGQVVEYQNGPGAKADMTDLLGNALSEKTIQEYRTNYFPRSYLSLTDPRDLGMPREVRVDNFGFQSANAYAQRLMKGENTLWFYLVKSRTIVGYNIPKWRFIGSVSLAGFAGASSPPRPLPEPLLGVSQYDGIDYGATMVYSFEPDKSQITAVYRAPGNDPIWSAGKLEGIDQGILVCTRSTIHVLQYGRELFQLPLEHSYPPFQGIYCSVLENGHYVFQYTNAWIQNGSEEGDWLVETDRTGKVVSRQQLPSQPWIPNDERWWDTVGGALAIPPGIALLRGGSEFSREYKWSFAGVGISAAAVMLVFLLPRYEPRKGMRMVWGIVGLLMGVSGVLLLLSMRSRVASVRCSNCGRRQAVTDGMCRHCHRTLEGPVAEGIEILQLV